MKLLNLVSRCDESGRVVHEVGGHVPTQMDELCVWNRRVVEPELEVGRVPNFVCQFRSSIEEDIPPIRGSASALFSS